MCTVPLEQHQLSLRGGKMCSLGCFSKPDSSLHSLPLSSVNGSKTGRVMVENFSPNDTKYLVQRTDPISRYRFNLRSRTQIGEGEPTTGESPTLLNEGKKKHDVSATLGGKRCALWSWRCQVRRQCNRIQFPIELDSKQTLTWDFALLWIFISQTIIFFCTETLPNTFFGQSFPGRFCLTWSSTTVSGVILILALMFLLFSFVFFIWK